MTMLTAASSADNAEVRSKRMAGEEQDVDGRQGKRLDFHVFMLRKRRAPWWLRLPEIFLVLTFVGSVALAIYLHRTFGGLPSRCECLRLDEGTLSSWHLFWSSIHYVPSAWWEGIGYSWWQLFVWPLGAYVAMRFCLTFGRILSRILTK